MSDSLRHHGLWPARLPQPWDFPGKNAGVGCRKISFSRRSSQSRDWTWVSCTEGRLFTVWATREAWRKAAFNSLPKRVMLSLDQITRDNHFSALVKHRHTNVECLFVKTTSGKNRMSLIHICLKLSPLSHQLYQVVVQGWTASENLQLCCHYLSSGSTGKWVGEPVVAGLQLGKQWASRIAEGYQGAPESKTIKGGLLIYPHVLGWLEAMIGTAETRVSPRQPHIFGQWSLSSWAKMRDHTKHKPGQSWKRE